METVPGFWQPWWSDKIIHDAVRSAGEPAFVWEDSSRILGFVCAHDLGFRASSIRASQPAWFGQSKKPFVIEVNEF